MMPALLTTMETSPHVRAALVMSSALVTSSPTGTTSSLVMLVVSRAPPYTLAPEPRSAWAMAAPRPRLAPVTSAVAPRCSSCHSTVFVTRFREEVERLLDELLVELEDAAVSGVGIDDQIGVRDSLGQIEGVLGGHHPVALAVRNEDWLADSRQVGWQLFAPTVDGLELGAVGAPRDGLVAVFGALLQPCQELLAGSSPVGGPGEEEELLGVLQGEQCSDRVEVREAGQPGDTVAPAGPVPARITLRTSVGSSMAITWAIIPPSRSPGGRPPRNRAPRMKATASVAMASMLLGVEPLEAPTPRLSNVIDAVLRCDAVDDPRVPVVQDGSEVGEEDHRDTGPRAEVPVEEVDTGVTDGASRCVLVRLLDACPSLAAGHGVGPMGR